MRLQTQRDKGRPEAPVPLEGMAGPRLGPNIVEQAALGRLRIPPGWPTLNDVRDPAADLIPDVE